MVLYNWKELFMLSVSDQWTPLRKCCEQTVLKALGRIIFQLNKGQARISVFSRGGLGHPWGERIASHEVRAWSAACKNGRCSCCWMSRGWHRHVALWNPGLGDTMARLCGAGGAEPGVTGPLFSSLHDWSDCLVTTHWKRVMFGERGVLEAVTIHHVSL